MMSAILQFLVNKFTTLTYISKVFGLASQVSLDGEKIIAVYQGPELTHINFDNYSSLVYILTNGNSTRTTVEHPVIATLEQVTEVYPLRAVVYSQGLENVNCNSYSQSLAQSIKANITGLQADLESALNAFNVIVRITDTDFNKSNVWKSQTTLPESLKDTDILISIDFEVSITGAEQCFTGELCSDYIPPNNSCDMIIEFTTVAGQTQYTKNDVPDLGTINSKTVKFAAMDSTILIPAFRNWDGSTFSIINIPVTGGEDIVIFAK